MRHLEVQVLALGSIFHEESEPYYICTVYAGSHKTGIFRGALATLLFSLDVQNHAWSSRFILQSDIEYREALRIAAGLWEFKCNWPHSLIGGSPVRRCGFVGMSEYGLVGRNVSL